VAQGQKMVKRNFDSPDETRPAGAGKAAVVGLGDVTLMKVTLEPGWKWSKDVKPLVNTASCQAPHLGYVLSGRLHVVMDDGSEEEFGPGDIEMIPPGHDAWVVGNEPVVALDITGAGIWAKPH
jgi:quercetin dioxygenase-like cupin family protein